LEAELRQRSRRTPTGRCRNYRILRGTDDSNYVVIELDFESRDEAEKFAAGLRELWDRVGDKLGLDGAQARLLETAETGEY
jgi:hypothetical protein